MHGSDSLMKQIAYGDLNASLQMIKVAAGKIWSNDAPKIVRYFTDHGMDHSERVAKYASQLLETNKGGSLSPEEIFLLLAGIYLHDIGMQWDVRCFPSIKEKAKNLGAYFEKTLLVSLREGGYLTSEFQDAVRRNHHYLSAAWLEYARETGETALGNAALSIPEELMSDLMTICKFHSQISMDNCPETSDINPDVRLKLIAAILRLADEMDIGKNRVSIESIKNFEFPIENSVFWWLHHQTKVSFENINSILLTVHLHPDDLDHHGLNINNIIIKKFIEKNQPLINILMNNSFEVKISDRCKIVGDPFIKEIPKEVISAIHSIQGPLFLLSKELSILLRAIRYEVGEPRLRTPYVDIIAGMDQGSVRQRILVRCIEGPITVRHVKELDSLLDRVTNQGWLITHHDVAIEAKDEAARVGTIEAFSLSDFLKDKIWGPYLKIFETDDFNEINRNYVDLACYKLERSSSVGPVYLDEVDSTKTDKDVSYQRFKKETFSNLDIYVDRWLNEPGKMHISLLGEFGSGKTWFCHHYAYRQLERYLKDPLNERMPLLITLRDFTKVLTIQLLINDAIMTKYRLPFVGDAFEIIRELNHRGKLLLILDGFDEMARQVDFQKIVDNFWELAKLVDDNSKVILTSRREFFREEKDAVSVFQGDEFGTFIEKLPAPKFDVVYQEPFNDKRVRDAISKRIGPKKGSALADRILSNLNLAALARKPVVLKYLLSALDEVGGDILEKPAQVYLYATNKLLFRNIEANRAFLQMRDFLLFGCELAWEMVKSGEMRIHFKKFPDIIKKHFKIKDPELDYWAYDLRNQSLLHRNPEGYYEFADKSIAEYFVAFKFAAELGCLAPEFTKTYLEINREPCIIPYFRKELADLSSTFGELSLRSSRMNAICEFMLGMMSEDASGRLWRIIDEIKEQLDAKPKFCGDNAAVLLQNLGSPKPYHYEDIIDVLETMQRSPETVFPSSPANIFKIKELMKTIESLPALKEAKHVFEIVQDANRLREASEIAENLCNEPGCRDFCLAVQAYAGLQSMYLNQFNEADRYFQKYLKLGGYDLWYKLKMGWVRLYQNKFNDARYLANDLISGNNQEISCRAYLLLGILDRIDRKYSDAIINFERARSISIEHKDRNHEGIALTNIGFVHRIDCQFDKALENYDKAYEIFNEQRDSYRLGCVQGRRGTVYRILNNFNKAIQDYQCATKLFDEVGDVFREGVVLRELGITYLIIGYWDKAIVSHQKALEIFNDPRVSRNPEANFRMSQAIYSLGFAYMMLGNWDQAINAFGKAIDFARNCRDSWNLCLALSGMGSAYRMKDEYENALFCLTRALTIARQLGNTRRIAFILTKLGSIYKVLHNNYEAIICLQEALEIAKDLGDLTRLGNISGSLGTVYRRIDDTKTAQKYYEDAIKIFADMDDQAKISWILGEIGQCYIIQGFFEKALEMYKESLSILHKIGGISNANIFSHELNSCKASDLKDHAYEALIEDSLLFLDKEYNLQGILHEATLKHKIALDDVQKLGNISLEGKIEGNLGDAFRRIGEYDEALIHLNRSLKIFHEINDCDQEAKTLCLLGMAYSSMGLYQEAIKKIQESIDIFPLLGDLSHRSWALEQLGMTYLKQKNWNEAVHILKKVLELNHNSITSHISLALCYRYLKDPNAFEAECKFARKLKRSKRVNDYELACLEAVCMPEETAKARRNRISRICQLITTALESGQVHVSLVSQDPLLQLVSDNPCFKELVKGSEPTIVDTIPFM